MGFRPGKMMTALVAVFLPLTLVLGWWQLSRAAEKNQWLSEMAEHSEVAVQWQEDTGYAVGQRVSLCVAPTGETWYLDNRTHEGRPGYEVFLPATACGVDTPVLLRLGWLGQQNGRSQLPSVEPAGTSDEVVIEALIRPNSPAPWLSAPPEAMGDDRWRIQSMEEVPDEAYIGARTVLQVTSPSDWQLVDNWHPVNHMPPERHIGYAIQWFGLALALVVCFVIWGRRQAYRISISRGNKSR